MGLYDDNDQEVVRLGGGWAAATQQAKNITYQQQKLMQQKQQQQQQEQRMAEQQQKRQPTNMFMPSKFLPQNIRPSNINKSKVPLPVYRPGQVPRIRPTGSEIVEEVTLQNSPRDVIDRFPDEYDPLKPNEFQKFLKRRREGKHKVTRYAEQKKAQERQNKKDKKRDKSGSDSSDDEEPDKRRRAQGMGKAMIAPPSLLYANSESSNPVQARKPTKGNLGQKLGLGGKPTLFGNKKVSMTPSGGNFGNPESANSDPSGLSVAEKIMQKMGHKVGGGLGKSGQGIAAPLEVEKTSRRGGKIILGKTQQGNYSNFQPGGVSTPPPNQPPPNAAPRSLPNLARPTKIVCLQNMVSPEEIDQDLPDEVTGECLKFGQVLKVKIVEIPNVPVENAVRIFIEFGRMEEAMKAVIGLHNRFFSGRSLNAAFYDVEKYNAENLIENVND